MSSDFYVYVWYRADTGIPIYVGKGRKERWKVHLTQRGHNVRLYRTLQKYGGRCEFHMKGLSEAEAIAQEIILISVLGRDVNGGTLYNMTDGGEGTVGYKHTQEEIERARLRSLSWSSEHRSKLSLATKRVWENPEFRAMQERLWNDPLKLKKRGDAIKRSWENLCVREKASATQKQIWVDPERREQARVSNKKFWRENPELLAKRGDAISLGKARRRETCESLGIPIDSRKGQPLSESHKMSLKAAWIARRAKKEAAKAVFIARLAS